MPEIRIDVPEFGQRVFVLQRRFTGKMVSVPCGFCGGSETGEIEGKDGTKARCPSKCDAGTKLVDEPMIWVVLGTSECKRECDRDLRVHHYMVSKDGVDVVLSDADEDLWDGDVYPVSDVFTSEAAAFAEAEERNSKR